MTIRDVVEGSIWEVDGRLVQDYYCGHRCGRDGEGMCSHKVAVGLHPCLCCGEPTATELCGDCAVLDAEVQDAQNDAMMYAKLRHGR